MRTKLIGGGYQICNPGEEENKMNRFCKICGIRLDELDDFYCYECEKWQTGSDVENMLKCKCNIRKKLVGDGCQICNPEMAKQVEEENKMDRFCRVCGEELDDIYCHECEEEIYYDDDDEEELDDNYKQIRW